jgi:branched-chain amino acid:cation transporter, LIVCS family
MKNGFLQGYQTMDLLAAFFFSKFVIKQLYETPDFANDERSLYKVFFKSALVGAGILSLVYFALVSLGRVYAPILAETPPQEMLGRIAMEALGSMAAPFVCIAVIFACMTTAIVLARLFAEFLRHEVFLNKIGNSQALFATLAIGFLVSTLDFAGIARFLGPLLETVYPALIVLTLVNIVSQSWRVRSSHWPFTLTIAAKLCLV